MARRDQRRSGGNRSATRSRKRVLDNEGIIPVLARAVREVESSAQRGPVKPANRTKFQAVALLVREERTRVKADEESTTAHRDEQLKRLDGIGTILAKTATRDPSLFSLLGDGASVSDATKALKAEMEESGGIEPVPVPDAARTGDDVAVHHSVRRVVPASVRARQLANPFLAPDFSHAPVRSNGSHRLATWELLGPLFRSFEEGAGGATSCMDLPEPISLAAPGGRELMPHQARMIASAAKGHRSFLLADEPGLGKTAQSLLAAEAADAFPLLVVVPNVVKTNWAREAQLWTPHRPATVIHGDGAGLDGFADIVVVNYEVLDRHAGWLGEFGFRGMVVDEAHFIKNKTSQRSQHVLHLADRIRARSGRPLMMALTGTPLINDIEDFRAIWQFLGWIEDKKPTTALMNSLEDTGLTPADRSFYPAARHAVVEMGIVRRRKVDVAADIPARRIADLPVELDDEAGRSIRAAERELARRLVKRYDASLAARAEHSGVAPGEGIDLEMVRRVATWEREDSSGTSEDNVFSLLRKIGRAKAGLAADYTAQLARSVGKVVFFAKHIDVMDAAQELFTERGIGFASVRGDQTSKVRQQQIDAFTTDPSVQIVVCSLTAAGVGINLQVASDVVLAELSWTDAEQTQAIDRVHRIGQDQPVTAWRLIAAQTLDTKIAELIDSKAGLAARALDGADDDAVSSADIQLEALVALLSDALARRA